jgi:hypothetical protein
MRAISIRTARTDPALGWDIDCLRVLSIPDLGQRREFPRSGDQPSIIDEGHRSKWIDDLLICNIVPSHNKREARSRVADPRFEYSPKIHSIIAASVIDP